MFALTCRIIVAAAIATALGCNGFGTGNSTRPGSTPNTATQKDFRMVGNIGTPFLAIVSDCRSSWQIRGVVPLNIIIANAPSTNSQCPDGDSAGRYRILATKLANDSRMLSVEAIDAYNVANIASTYTNYGNLAANLGGAALKSIGPPAYPDVRFFITNPGNGTFNAVVEDLTNAYILQSQSPTVILYDFPNGGSTTERVDGIFTTVSGGPMAIDLTFNGQLVTAGGGGTVSIKIH